MAADEAGLSALMRAGLAGDGAAHRDLLTALAPLLRGFFRARLRNSADSEDLVQETLIAIHSKRATYDPSLPFLPWTFAIARYRLIDHIRKQKRRGVSVDVADSEAELQTPSDAEAGTATRDIARLLNLLPEKQRAVIEMVKLREASVREAAEALGLSESDVKVSIHRGLKTLMQKVAQEERQ